MVCSCSETALPAHVDPDMVPRFLIPKSQVHVGNPFDRLAVYVNQHIAFLQSGVYINDDWRARPDLTISLGLRYETQTNIHVGKDFGPRAALAWSPGAKSSAPPKTVFRVGWGIFYGRVNPFLTQQALRFNGTTEQQHIVQNPDFYPVLPAIGSLMGGQSLTTYRLADEGVVCAVD